jgi:hypothetical protein
MNWAGLTALSLGYTTAGCWGGVDCPTIVGTPALVVMVVDSVTELPVAEGAFGSIVRHGVSTRLTAYGLRGLPPNDALLSLAATPSDAGLYLVTVSRTGYQQWQRGDVHLTKGQCGFATTTVTAKLQPAP